MTIWSELPLTEQHVKMLVRSGITPEIASERGYRSIEPGQTAELSALTPTPFGRRSCHPGLLVPSHSVTGGVVGHQLRPDADVIHPKSGDVMKYLTPYGEHAMLDCPPRMIDSLRNVDVPLLITEGAKKADAAAARGLLCLALRGVDNWTSQQGTALEDWRDILLLGRNVGIAYDSDFASNKNVRGAAKRLAKYLTRRGANVRYVLLNPRDNGEKVGLDDWLVDHPDDDPWALGVEKLPELESELDPTKTPVRATDLDVADEWVARNVHQFRYVTQTEAWMGFDGGRWNPESGVALARASFQDMIRTLFAYQEKIKDGVPELVDATGWLYSSDRITAVLKQAAANRLIHTSVRELDVQPYLFNLGNCTYDLRRDVVLRHDPEDLISLGSQVDYDPDAGCPNFIVFLELVLPEPETRAFVQRIFGMAMIGDSTVKQHVFPVFQGTGRNGKGTLMRLVQAVFGSYYSGISKSLLVVKQREEHDTIKASLFRKRLVTAQEVGEQDTWNAAMIKELTGGDDITGRFMRENEFTFAPSHTLVMAANDWPKVSAKDEAFWRRVRKVPFTTTFERDDPSAEKVLKAELPGILNWLLAGCRDYQQNGLGEPAQVAAATAASRADSNPLQSFLNEYTEVTHDPEHQVLFAELYDHLYISWHRNTRQTGAMVARNKFGAEVASTAGIEAPHGIGKNKVITFFGMRLADGQTTPQNSDPLSTPSGGPSRPASGPAEGGSGPADAELEEDRPDADRTPTTVAGPLQDQAGPLAGPLEVALHIAPPAKAGPAGPAGPLFPHSPEGAEKAGKPVTRLTTLPTFQADSLVGGMGGESGPAGPAKINEPDTQGDKLNQLVRTDPCKHLREKLSGGAVQGDLLADTATYERLAPADFEGVATEPTPAGVLVFDIEGPAAEKVFTGGPGFIKIFGYQVGAKLKVTENVVEAVELILHSRIISGHNIMNFDLITFAMYHGLDIHQAAADGRFWDTQLVEVLLNPPPYWMEASQVPGKYSLDLLGQQKFGLGKSHNLTDLVKKHGGHVAPKGKPGTQFEIIPNDDAEYVTYCAADVDLTRRLAKTQSVKAGTALHDYVRREHRIAAIATQVSINGFKVDVDLLNERAAAVEKRKAELRERLMDQYGMPRFKKDGKSPARGMTEAGRAAVERAFGDFGVELPRSKSGKGPATDKLTMDELMETYADRPEVTDLVETVKSFNGQRTVYGSALAALHPDGRVHPQINMYQSTGRWSVTKPGLTVFGKRGGRYVEREIFIPDEGEVIIAADLSQVDARAIAAWSQDPEYMKMFEPGMDLHAEVAFQMFADRARRDDAKALSHGYNYGLGFNKLAKAHGPELARIFLDTMIEKFPRLVEWKDEIRRESADNGYRLDNGWGKPLVIDPDSNFTQAPALVGQSAARDIMMEGLLRLPRWVLPMLRVQVHDEIVLSVPEDRVDEIKAIVVDALSFPWRPFNGARGHEKTVQILADSGKHGTNWGSVYEK